MTEINQIAYGMLYGRIAGTLTFFLIFAYLFWQERFDFFKFWSVFWGLSTLNFVFAIFLYTNRFLYLSFFLYLATTILAGFYLIKGTLNYFAKPDNKILLKITVIALLLAGLGLYTTNWEISLIVSSSYLSLAYIYIGNLFRKEGTRFMSNLIGKVALVFGVLVLLYPYIYNQQWFNPYINILMGILGMVFGLGLIGDYYEKIQNELKKARGETKSTKKQLEAILESIQDGISVLNPDLTIQYTNWAMENWYQEKMPLEGKKCYEAYHGRNKACSNCPSKRCLETGEVEKEIIPIEESKIDYVELFSYPMIDDKTGEVEGVVEFVRDITERKKQEEKIQYISYHDELTGLYNRSYIQEEIARLDTKRQLPISIIIADVNGLKIINDTYGHSVGDQLLIKSASIFKETMRDEDIISRYGGDEFLILLPQTKEKSTKKIAKRLKENFAKAKVKGIDMSLAIGIATKTKSKEEIYDIIEEADDNMYQNKLTKKRSSKSKIVKGLLNTLSAKSDETKEHALRMTDFAFKLGEKINLSDEQLNNLSLLASLHDIGKVTISEDILTKPAKLNEKEWKLMKKHTKKGYTIATATEEFAPIAKSILSHHERWDGTGYPQRLAQKEIPLLARVIAIVDAYDVMTSGRPYKEAMKKEAALKELKRCAGSQFDPNLVKKFIEMMED